MGEQFENYVRLEIDRRGLVAKQEFMWEKLKKLTSKRNAKYLETNCLKYFEAVVKYTFAQK